MSDPVNTNQNPAENMNASSGGLGQKLLANKTPFLIIFLVIATVLLVALALAPRKDSLPSPQKLLQKEVSSETTLALSEVYESEEASESGNTMLTDVQIKTGNNNVTGVQLEIKYNPALLTNIEIIPGEFFSDPTILLDRIDTQEGIISYALGAEEKGVKGEGVVATLSFSPRGIAGGETSFEFLSKTAVSAEGEDKSVLVETIGLEFTLEPSTSTSPSAQTTPAQ